MSPLEFGEGFFGAVLTPLPPRDVRPLFDALIDHSGTAFSVAVQMIATYVFGATGKLEDLRPQIRRIAENISRWSPIPDVAMVRGCFEEIMNWMLRKGREEPDACATALALGRALVDFKDYGQVDLLTPIVPLLLADFPEVVWPLFGQALVSNEEANPLLESLLMDTHGNKNESALLQLPEHTLFAWCHAHPDRAPAIAARCLPDVRVIQKCSGSVQLELAPVMSRLLDEFGDRYVVLRALEVNMGNFTCEGSASDFLARYEAPLASLRQHPTPRVREWAVRMLHRHRAEVQELRKRNEERTARAEFS